MQLLFHNQSQAAVYLSAQVELPQAIDVLNLKVPAPVLVLVGGAEGVEAGTAPRILAAAHEIAKAVEASGACILDGGTHSGVMAAIGQARFHGLYSFPLVGVAVKDLVTSPGRPEEAGAIATQIKSALLDPDHSHFVLVPGSDWGDESLWIASLARWISAGQRSMTVLINGGEIARQDLACSVADGREVLVLRSSGRLADQVAEVMEAPGKSKYVHLNRLVNTGNFTVFDISDSLAGLDGLIRQKLQKP